MQHEPDPPTGRGNRSFLVPVLIVAVVVVFVVLHLTGVVGAASH